MQLAYRDGIQGLKDGNSLVGGLDVSTTTSGVGEQVVLRHKSQNKLDDGVAGRNFLTEMSIGNHSVAVQRRRE